MVLDDRHDKCLKSIDKDDTRAGIPPPNLLITPPGGRFVNDIEFSLHQDDTQDGPLLESCFEPITLRFRSRDLTIKPMRPCSSEISSLVSIAKKSRGEERELSQVRRSPSVTGV
ncbi:hypothetical protein AVEN_252590-1 [Araneus ventricosus]|uniref:Uncharacterized protein n=1 Tax=Araneus ventricosus TaxID=182803 RepID=A0A4Y2AT94_ARAVE|nr:hypothetical protein AVEN_252590-1 [Araneus ventricosus]